VSRWRGNLESIILQKYFCDTVIFSVYIFSYPPLSYFPRIYHAILCFVGDEILRISPLQNHFLDTVVFSIDIFPCPPWQCRISQYFFRIPRVISCSVGEEICDLLHYHFQWYCTTVSTYLEMYDVTLLFSVILVQDGFHAVCRCDDSILFSMIYYTNILRHPPPIPSSPFSLVARPWIALMDNPPPPLNPPLPLLFLSSFALSTQEQASSTSICDKNSWIIRKEALNYF